MSKHEHGDWDAGGHCNRLIETPGGYGDVCGFNEKKTPTTPMSYDQQYETDFNRWLDSIYTGTFRWLPENMTLPDESLLVKQEWERLEVAVKRLDNARRRQEKITMKLREDGLSRVRKKYLRAHAHTSGVISALLSVATVLGTVALFVGAIPIFLGGIIVVLLTIASIGFLFARYYFRVIIMEDEELKERAREAENEVYLAEMDLRDVQLSLEVETSKMAVRINSIDWLIDYLRDKAEDRGWVEGPEGDYPGICEVRIWRGMTLDDLEAVAHGLSVQLFLEVRNNDND